jgi:hypothetical protein
MTYGTVNADVITTSTAGGVLGAGNASLMKNRIINGEFKISQYNGTSASANTINGYFIDRWEVSQITSGKIIAQQNAGSVTPPVGFSKYLGITSQSAYSITSSDRTMVSQWIEGNNISDLAWGTANAKTVTLSFWVYSSLTGTFGGAVINGTPNRGYPFSYTISSANTWTQISVTIAGDTTGTWSTDNSAGIGIRFGLGVGSTYLGTAGAWAAGNYAGATGQTNVLGTSGATLYITGVQLEVGSSATGFEYVNYQTSLANCQRYYQLQTVSTYGAVDGSSTVFNGTWVPKRATPTATITSNFTLGGLGAAVDGYGAYANGQANNRNIFTVISSAEL